MEKSKGTFGGSLKDIHIQVDKDLWYRAKEEFPRRGELTLVVAEFLEWLVNGRVEEFLEMIGRDK